MTTRAEACQVVIDYVLTDFEATVGSGQAPAEMMTQITAGIGAQAALAVDALTDAGLLTLTPE